MIKAGDSIVSLLGVAISQSFFFIAIWLIGTYGGPGILGKFNYDLALGMFIGTVFVARYELSCVSNSRNDSLNALIFILAFAFGIFTFLASISIVFFDAKYFVIVAFSFSYICHQAIMHYLNSLRAYVGIAAIRTFVNFMFIIYFALILMFKMKGYFFVAYTIIYFVTCIAFSFFVFYQNKKRSGKKANDILTIEQFISFFKRNYRYPVYILPSTLCASVLTYAMALLLPSWFGATTAGFFALAYRIGFFPVSLVAQSIGGVFRRDMLSAVNSDEPKITEKNVYFLYAKWLLLLSALYAISGFFLFKPCVYLLFGSEWGNAVKYYIFMIPLFCLQIIYIPLSQLFLVYKKQKMDFQLNFIMAAVLLLVIFISKSISVSSFELVASFSLTASIIMLIGICLTYLTVKKS